MYQDHWKLKAAPFENTPDLRFLFESRSHEEAVARLQYLVAERRACGVLTGVYGCGKTLVLHHLAKTMGAEGNVFSVVTNPRLDELGLLRVILHGFKKGAEVPTGKADVLMELEKLVTGVAEDGKHAVVVIDEAHAIESDKVFEELRLLLNLQTEERYLLTLILAGQSELRPRVEANKQFNQRVGLRYHLGPFSPAETKAYVEHRLGVAAGNGAAPTLFPQDVIELIHKLSGGIPRWINQICHLSLMVGYSREAGAITPDIVQEAVRDMVGAPAPK